MIQRKNPLFHHFLQALQSRLCAIIAKHYCFGSIYFWRILFQQKRLFFWFLVYFGKYGLCTIVHIMTQSCKPSYIKLFKAFYSKAPHPMVKKFFKIWRFDLIHLMILDGLIHLLGLSGPNVVFRIFWEFIIYLDFIVLKFQFWLTSQSWVITCTTMYMLFSKKLLIDLWF